MTSQKTNKWLTHALVVAFFSILAILYGLPAFQGKRLSQHDIIQAQAAAHEVSEYHQQTGEWSAWTNSMFGGMPAYMIGGSYPNSLISKIGGSIMQALPMPTNLILLLLLCGYLLCCVLTEFVWIRILGTLIFCFGTYNLIFIQAGHVSKVIAIAYAPAVLAGVILVFRGKIALGGALTALFLGLELYANHLQITYYLFIVLSGYGVIKIIQLIRTGEIKMALKAIFVLGIAVIIGVGSHSTRLWNAYSYSKETIRGGTELTPNKNSSSTGLDKEYVFAWSYGVQETLTLLIPNVYGGSSMGGVLNEKSNVGKLLADKGVNPSMIESFVQQLGTYWGAMPITNGPSYAGAIVCFLFVFGAFIIRSRWKWFFIGFTILFIFWSWGKNFEGFNTLFFSYFPGFNKFRSVTMVHSLIYLWTSVIVVMTMTEFFNDSSWSKLKKPLLFSFLSTGGVCLIIWVGSGLFFDFRSPNDVQLQNNLQQAFGESETAKAVMTAFRKDRQTLLESDALRSFIFILLACGTLVLYSFRKITRSITGIALIILCVFDLYSVNRRYFNDKDYVSKYDAQEEFFPFTPLDSAILKDKTYYRVVDFTTSTFNDARRSYYHKSIGGYHGAKLRRFQELVENQIAKNNKRVLDMLNTKYFVIGDTITGKPSLQLNPDALGNAWFVSDIKWVKNADDEMAALTDFNPKKTAIIDEKFKNIIDTKVSYDSTEKSNTIQLTYYKPNELNYESNLTKPALAVFSEIYYRGNKDWISSIDGTVSPHLRSNYLLRSMVIPAGKHTICFRFDPISVRYGKIMDLCASILLVLFVGWAIYSEKKKIA